MTQEFSWRPVFVEPTGEARGAYATGAGTVFADVTTYATERRGAKLIGYGSDPTGPAGSTVLEDHRRSLGPVSAPGPAVRDFVVRTADGEYWRIWQWYQVGAAMTPDPLHAKLRQGLQGLAGRLGSGAVSIAVRCRTVCRSGEGDDLLYVFLHDMREALESAALGGPRES